MASLVDGKISDTPIATLDESGEFQRADSAFRGEVLTSDARPGRFHLYVSAACPWAHRTLIFRKLKGLEDIIGVSVSDPYMGPQGWTFDDPKYLAVLYVASNRHYTGKITVPVLWDKERKSILNNESSEIIRILNSSFDHLTGNNLDFYPEEYRSEIDRINEKVYHAINNGVYKTGFATTQEAYEKNFRRLFSALDEVDSLLSARPYLAGDKITEADIRLFTTLIRFDVVYYSHFKCNQRLIRDYHHLYNYTKAIYQIPGVKETCDFTHIKEHYYQSHDFLNPSRITPLGPNLDDLERPHNRGEPQFFYRK